MLANISIPGVVVQEKENKGFNSGTIRRSTCCYFRNGMLCLGGISQPSTTGASSADTHTGHIHHPVPGSSVDHYATPSRRVSRITVLNILS